MLSFCRGAGVEFSELAPQLGTCVLVGAGTSIPPLGSHLMGQEEKSPEDRGRLPSLGLRLSGLDSISQRASRHCSRPLPLALTGVGGTAPSGRSSPRHP